MHRKITLSILLAGSIANGFAQQSGTLDPTFHNDGLAFHNKFNQSFKHPSEAKAILVMPDSTILVGGQSETDPLHPLGYQGFMLCRLSKNGYVLDTLNAPNYGSVFIHPAGINAPPGLGADGNGVRDLDLLPNGQVLMTASVLTGGYQCMTTFRLNYPSLTLDTTYGVGGMGQLWKTGYNYQIASQSVITADGSSYEVGYGPKNFPTDTLRGYVIKRRANGMLDSSWQNNGGHAYLNQNGILLFDIAVASNGNIYTCGIFRDASQIDHAIVRRQLPGGNPDPSFGSNGIAMGPYQGASLVLMLDGSVYLNGWTNIINSSNAMNSYVMKFKANGQPDSAFGQSGISKIPTPPGVVPQWTYYAYDMLRQADGKILQVGRGQRQNDSVWFAAWRIKTNGTLDSTFGVNGIAEFHVMHPQVPAPMPLPVMRTGSCGALQPDGKLLIGGYFGITVAQPEMLVMRLNNTVAPTYISASSDTRALLVQVAPNPARGELCYSYSLDAAQVVTATLTDMRGRVVARNTTRQSAGSHNGRMSVSELPGGQYMLYISSGSGAAGVPVTIVGE